MPDEGLAKFFGRPGEPEPAEVAAARVALEGKLIAEAEQAEADAGVYYGKDNEIAEHYALTRANNLRLRAICLRTGIGDARP